MSKHAYACAASAPPIDPELHRRIAMRRVGLQGAVARVVSELAFGPTRRGDVIALAGLTAARIGGECR